ncbi:hypothetical protein MBLNU230_g2290t1 [Neophaeotheca triangularis]
MHVRANTSSSFAPVESGNGPTTGQHRRDPTLPQMATPIPSSSAIPTGPFPPSPGLNVAPSSFANILDDPDLERWAQGDDGGFNIFADDADAKDAATTNQYPSPPVQGQGSLYPPYVQQPYYANPPAPQTPVYQDRYEADTQTYFPDLHTRPDAHAQQMQQAQQEFDRQLARATRSAQQGQQAEGYWSYGMQATPDRYQVPSNTGSGCPAAYGSGSMRSESGFGDPMVTSSVGSGSGFTPQGRESFGAQLSGQRGGTSPEGRAMFSAPLTQEEEVEASEEDVPMAKRGKESICKICGKGFNFSKTNRGKMCTKCWRTKQKEKAPTSTFKMMPEIDSTAAMNRIYPANEPLGLEVDNFAWYSDHFDQGSDYWVKLFLDACNTPTTGGDPSNKEQSYYLGQQKAFNVTKLSNEEVNVRLRLLFLVTYRYHAGGAAVYPTGGDNDGYYRSKGLKFEQRLEDMRAALALDKRVCLDILHGKGTVAFMEGPNAYQRRKVQNKHGNAKKDQARKIGEGILEGEDETTETATPKSVRGGKVPGGRKRKPTESIESTAKRYQTAPAANAALPSPPAWLGASVPLHQSRPTTAAPPGFSQSPMQINDRPAFVQSGSIDPRAMDEGSVFPIERVDHDQFMRDQISGNVPDPEIAYNMTRNQNIYGPGGVNTFHMQQPDSLPEQFTSQELETETIRQRQFTQHTGPGSTQTPSQASPTQPRTPDNSRIDQVLRDYDPTARMLRPGLAARTRAGVNGARAPPRIALPVAGAALGKTGETEKDTERQEGEKDD